MGNVSIIGAGTWGCALSYILSIANHHVVLFSPIKSEVSQLKSTRKNRNLPSLVLPEVIEITDNVELACLSEIIIFAVPSVYFRDSLLLFQNFIKKDHIIVSATKGLEEDTLYTMSEVAHSIFPNNSVVALSGPTHAEEVANLLPSTIVSACANQDCSIKVANLFIGTCIRAYTNHDVVGIELCGALKNIVALMCGIADGAGYGDNFKSAIMTRGLNEIKRLGKAMGCYEQTFYGLAGMGDLVATATSTHSRNNKCGQLIGQGYNVEQAVEQVGMVVEGLNALRPAINLAKRYKVKMSIISSLALIIFDGKDPKAVLEYLTNKSIVSELDKSELDLIYENNLIKNSGGFGMKRVITYGTFDLLHYGHINLLKRAKALGDYLIVCVSTDEFNFKEKHKKTYFTYEQRKILLESLRYVDLVIPEENWQQKRTDMHDFKIDTFVMGDDWRGKFDFLKEEGVEVVYLPRTPEISSTKIKKDLYDANAVAGESVINHDDINADPDK